MASKHEPHTPMKVVHVMADGTIRESLKGYVILRTAETEAFYRLAEKYVEREIKCREDTSLKRTRANDRS